MDKSGRSANARTCQQKVMGGSTMDWRGVNAFAKFLVGYILILILICSCKTRSQVITVQEDVKTDTIYKSLLRTDSVMIYDSIHVRETPDTGFMEKWRHTSIIRKEHDTIYHHSVDTIKVPIEVEKKLNRWQRTKQDWGGFAILLAIGMCILFVRTRSG